MIYTNLYHKFISSRPKRIKRAYDGLENHHIIPLSIGGTNIKSNLIALTPREHYIAHRILVKKCNGLDATKMALALHRMATGAHKLKYKISSRTYQYLRELRSKAYQDWLKSPKGMAFRLRQSQRRAKSNTLHWIEYRKKRQPKRRENLPKWTPERRAKFMSRWTPERRALYSQRLKGNNLAVKINS